MGVEAVRKVTLWRGALVVLFVAVVGVLFAVQVRHAGPDAFGVEDYVQLERAPWGTFRLFGYFDPESVVRDEEGLRFDVLAIESSDTTRVTVVCEPDARLDESVYWVAECVVTCRAGEGTATVEAVSPDPVFFRTWGPTRFDEADRPYEFHRLTARSKKAQLEMLLGERLELEGVNEWAGMPVYPNEPVELYRDERGDVWIYNQTLGTWVGQLPESADQTPGRVYPGETPRDECLNRADALARQYFTGDPGTWPQMFRSWQRRVMEAPTGPIVSYDVLYERFVVGIRMPDAVSVTVYALSGGSDFVGVQVSDEVTFTVEPQVTALRADRVVREQSELAEDARLTGFELVVWGGVLHWRMAYDEPLPESPEGTVVITGEPPVFAVDATTGDLIDMPIRDVR